MTMLNSEALLRYAQNAYAPSERCSSREEVINVVRKWIIHKRDDQVVPIVSKYLLPARSWVCVETGDVGGSTYKLVCLIDTNMQTYLITANSMNGSIRVNAPQLITQPVSVAMLLNTQNNDPWAWKSDVGIIVQDGRAYFLTMWDGEKTLTLCTYGLFFSNCGDISNPLSRSAFNLRTCGIQKMIGIILQIAKEQDKEK